MKRCPTCQGVYDDAKNFCPKCGVALTNAETISKATKTGNVFLERWGGLLLSFVGFAVCWGWSAVLGSAIAAVAAFCAWLSDNPVNKFGSLFVAVISVILTIITMM